MMSPRKYNQTTIHKNFFSNRLSIGLFVFSLAFIFAGTFTFRTQAATGINQQISFQGKVVNSNGTNVANGSYTFVFSLYTVSSGGANIWTESKSLTVTDGIFQTNLGDTTTLPGSVDFNTDNIYLGINFNADGEMSPRVRFTAAPYAFNAKKVGGLTVTDTTGTLTIPNGKTISFADAFTTTGAFPLTLTTTASTTATLPSGTITLADLTTAQSLTNKTIGSTGLVFSGATTDITTATGEDLTVVANGAGIINLNDSVTSGALTISGAATDITTASGESLVIVANGAGVVDIQDATTVDSLTADTGGVSIAAGQSYTGAGAVTLSSAAATALTVDSGTTGALNLGTGNNAKTIALGTGTAGNTINIGTDNSVKDTINIGSALDDVAITGDQWSITNAGVLTVASCSGCGSGSTTWDAIGDPSGNGAIAFGSTLQTLDWGTMDTNGSYFTFNFTNGGTAAGTDNGVVINNAQKDTASTDTNTENLLLIQQLDTTTGNTITVNNALSIDVAGSSAMTNAINITNSAGNLTTGINIADTAGGTLTDGIVVSGTLTNILNSPSLDITGAGAITGATGVSTTTVTASSTIDAQGDISDSTGNLTLNDAVDISGALAVSGTSLTATSATTITLGSTGADTITLGNGGADTITIGNAASTGVSIVDNNWSVTTAGVATFVSSTVIGSQTFTTNNIADSGALTISSGGANTALTLNSATTGTINIGTDASAETINIGNTGAAAKTVLIGDSAQTNTVTIGSATATTVSITDNNWSISAAGAAAFASLSSSGAIAANGGITFDQTTDTVGAHTMSGTLDMNTNIITNIGNTGTDFVASTGALTLAGVLTANGGISISTQSLTGTTGIIDYTNFDVDGTGNITVAVSKGLDTNAAGAIQIGKTNATSVDICNAANCDTINIGNLATVDADTIVIGDTLDTFSIASTAFNVSTTGALTGVTTLSASSAIAANGGITFDNSTDTVGAFTAAGAIDMNTNIITNIGNTGTDFVASTGALTLAGVLTANGGITLAGSQSFTASALSYMDLGAITHSTTANQGLRLPNAASATPSNPTSGEGYLAWDASGNQVIYYNGSAWATFSAGSGYATIKDETTGLTQRTTLAFLGAGVTCADNVTQTECTIAGGSGSDLQGTYGADADGSNATISLTAADDGLVFTNPTSGGNDLSTFLLQLDQANTTANVKALDIVQASNASNAVNITANSIDGETGLAITMNGLTSGKGISIASSATAFTGNLADVQLTGSNAANTGNVLAVSNTGTANANTSLFVDHRATGTGNLAMRVDDESGDTTPFIVDGEGRVGIGTSSISANAATERLLQVGSETNRGNTAVYGEIISKGLDRHTALTGIKDVFVYDTTGDSDGGRWIDWATTDNLSWYTESLDDGASDPCNIATDDRCYKASFPRKAILVVTTDALYIFDAATNDMWMKFSQNASGYALGVDTNNDPSSVTALNGVIYVGANGTSAGGLYAFDFVNDRMWNYNGTNRSAANTGISGRNAAATYNVDSDVKLEISPVGTAAEWERVNDVAATVMTNSLSPSAINSLTGTNSGMGKVFVGLATDSGVTVINMADRVLNQYSDVTADDYTAVAITRKGQLYALNTTQDQLERWDTIDSDKASEVNGTYTRKWDETVATGPALASAAFNILAGYPDNLEIAESASVTSTAATGLDDIIYVGHSLGLVELHDNATQTLGWVKYFNSTRQTPMMPLNEFADMVLPMDDTSGTQAQDLSIANTDMAIFGSPTLGVNGVQGKAIQFDNTNDFLCSDANSDNVCDVDTAFNMTTVGWTVSMWFKHSTTAPTGSVDTLFEKCVTATPSAPVGCVIAYMNTTGTITAAYDATTTWTRPDSGTGAVYDVTATTTYAYNDNQWHHLLMTRTNASNMNVFVDANTINLSTATAQTATLDGSQIVTIGASCSTTTGANCAAANALNFWDGAIDDVQVIIGTTTVATMAPIQVRRLYNIERPRASKRMVTVTDATSADSTSLTDTGESWYPNELAGLIVEITGSSDTDCIGVTRRISSNTATSLTFTPAVPGTCTMDTTADFQVDPEALYGGTDSIAGIGITAESPLGEARQLCVGTNSGTDTGGVTCYNHQVGPSIVADVYHSQASQTDNTGTDWTGSNYDEMVGIDLSTRSLIMASEAHFTSVTEDVRLGQGLDYIANQLYMIRQELVLDGISVVGSTAIEVGFTGGADLAENYYSDTPLEAGTVVALDRSKTAYVNATNKPYARDMLGIVATAPGIVLGDALTNGYPVALAGRVPVKVTNENGPIYAGDRITSASRSGYAMRATQAGRVIGQALADATDWSVCEGENPMNRDAVLCTTVMVFVNLTDYYGQPVELAMAERDKALEAAVPDEEVGITGVDTTVRLATATPTREEKLLTFLKEIRDERAKNNAAPSEVFTDRVVASTEVVTPKLIVDEILAKSIKADSIEGLAIYTKRIASLEAKYAGLIPDVAPETGDVEVAKEKTLLNLEQFRVGNIAVAFDANVLGKLSVTGALRVIDAAEFQGEATFASLASFLSDSIFKGRVAFEKAPTFGSDTAGFATIEKGRKKVRVHFTEVYEKQPIVTVALTRDLSPLLDADANEDLKADVAAVEKDFAETLFDAGIQYLVTEKDQTGFTILLSKDAPADLSFSWVAMAVKSAKTFESGKGSEEPKADIPAIQPVETGAVPVTPPVSLPAETAPVPDEAPAEVVTPAPVPTTT